MAPSSKAPSPDKAADLTYRDVQMILAVVDSWHGGRVRLVQGDLSVDAVLDPDTAVGSSRVPSPSRAIVRAAAVGVFQREPSATPGSRVRDADVIGTIMAPGRTTPVTAGATGSFSEWLVQPGEFVEYGQAVAAVSSDSE